MPATTNRVTEESFALAMSLGTGFLDEYQWLNQWSKDCGRKSFHVVHKHHSFMHLLKNSKYMNPKAYWRFKAEDYVGHISRPTHSISMGVKSTKLSQKLCPKYRVLVHLLLTRAVPQGLGGYMGGWGKVSLPGIYLIDL